MNKLLRDFLLVFNRVFSRVTYRSNNLLVFGEWMGKRADDSCMSLANYIADRYPNEGIVWIADETADLHRLNPRIKRISIDSKEAKSIAKNAKAIIMNQGLGDVSKSETFNPTGPLKVNLWHGVAWKKIGYDGLKDGGYLRNAEHKLQIAVRKSDVYVAPSAEFGSILEQAFFVDSKQMVFSGLPRNNAFFDSEEMSDCRKKLLSLLGVREAFIVIYLPTFRDKQSKPFNLAGIDDKEFWKWAEENNVFFLQKAHFAEKNSFGENNKHVINVTDFSAQELMLASNMLITDYSSCFFDYLVLNRPIIHFIYDYDYYKNRDRGLYYDKKDVVCGAAPETVDGLKSAIVSGFENPNEYEELRRARRERYMTYESKDNCKNVADRIFAELEG